MTEIDDFGAVVRDHLDAWWSTDHLRSSASVSDLWERAASAGWFDLTGDLATAALLKAMEVLGAAACPLPLADAWIAQQFLPEDLRARVAAGALRLVTVPGSAVTHDRCLVELPQEIDSVLVIATDNIALRPVTSFSLTDGLPAPAWGTAVLGAASWHESAESHRTDRAQTVMRVAHAARAAGAAERLHRMAVEHACTRMQFGKVIGSFGAVQQRTATCEIDVVVSRLLLDLAAGAFDRGAPSAELDAEIATGFVGVAARRVLLGAHHTLAAVGFFEEHAGPWLFRRVHTDLALAARYSSTQGTAIDRLVETDQGLPSCSADLDAESFRATVREALATLAAPSGAIEREACIAALVDRGWLGMSWPPEQGGLGADVGREVVLNEELTYARAPVEIEVASVMLLGNAILTFGSPDQRERFLPLVRRGQMRFCLGYSEPETGSDLASLRTRADEHRDGWVVNAQKIWTTRADQADYMWLAARTDPQAQPRHAGITVFLVPMATPGITVVPMTALSGERAATVFLDNVVIPDSARVGPLHGGWAVITQALAGERVVMGGVAAQLHRVADDVLDRARRDPESVVGPRGSQRRYLLERTMCELQGLRALVAHATKADGVEAYVTASMAGVFGGELAESYAETLLDVLGPSALLDDPSVIGGGHVQHLLRQSVMYVVGGGTNDIQRGLIARSLGLPR